MNYQKTPVIYEGKDPNQEGVTFVAIQTETQPPYIFEIYSARNRRDLPKLKEDIVVLPVEQARRLFDFKEGNLADLVIW
mgnify:CR=1 FL=1